jgi:hypothetical protein
MRKNEAHSLTGCFFNSASGGGTAFPMLYGSGHGIAMALLYRFPLILSFSSFLFTGILARAFA